MVVLIWNFMRDEKYRTEVTLINQLVVVFIRDFMQDEKYCTEVTLINQSVAVLIWNFMRDEKYWTKVTTNQSISGSPHLKLHARWKISHQVTPLNQSVVSHYVELHAGREILHQGNANQSIIWDLLIWSFIRERNILPI